MTDRDVRIIKLREVDKLSYRDISKLVNVSYELVRQTLKKYGKNSRIVLISKAVNTCAHCNVKKLGVYFTKAHGYSCRECYKKIKNVRKYTWSCKYKCCIKCKKTSSSHATKGLCNLCYQRYKYKNDKEYRLKKIAKWEEWKKNNKEKFNKYRLEYHKKHYVKKQN